MTRGWRSHAHWRRMVVIPALAGLTLAPAACSVGLKEGPAPTSVDRQRLDAVRRDPVLAGYSAVPATTKVGSANVQWQRASLSRDEKGPAVTDAEILAPAVFTQAWMAANAWAQRTVARTVQAARKDGWTLGYAACAPGVPDQRGTHTPPEPSTWKAELRRSVSAEGGSFDVLYSVSATVPPNLGAPAVVRAGVVLPYHAEKADLFADARHTDLSAAQSCAEAASPPQSQRAAGTPAAVTGTAGPPR